MSGNSHRRIEHRESCRIVNEGQFIVHITTANLILVTDVVVHRRRQGSRVLPKRCLNWNIAGFNISGCGARSRWSIAGADRDGTAVGSGRHGPILQCLNVSSIASTGGKDSQQCAVSGRSRCRKAGGKASLPKRCPFIVHKEKQLILEDRTTQLTSKAVAVIPWVFWSFAKSSCKHHIVVNGIQILVLEIFVCGAVEAVTAAGDA